MPLFTYIYASPEHGRRTVTLDCWAETAEAAAQRAAAFLRPLNARLRRAGEQLVRLPTAADMRQEGRHAQ